MKDEFKNINEYFSDKSIVLYKKTIQNYIKNKELSVNEGLAQFKTENIGSIGSDEWKELIIAAKSFAEIQYDNVDLYPDKNDYCLLCHQSLSKEAGLLIDAYWKYLTSNAEKNLTEIADAIEELNDDLKELDTKVMVEETTLHEWLVENSESTFKTWNAELKSIEGLKKQILAVLKSKNGILK
ncbi:MAG: hypothetical protein IPJ32_04530 [Sphingobacteriaceae bacterium]|nr:hypothetical protein [Sphingobacteriaceae bacterium]